MATISSVSVNFFAVRALKMETHGTSHAMEITLAPGRCASAHLQRGSQFYGD
jgi:hypothetical protein